MQPSLVFRPLAVPLPDKVLLAFRKDAGWSNRDAGPGAGERPGSLVQWVTVEAGKRRVGIARLELAPPVFCYVSDLIVLNSHRGCGIGEWFMKQIEQHCIARAIPRMLLLPMDGSRRFYDKLDFIDDPMAAGFLKKDIGPARRIGLPF